MINHLLKRSVWIVILASIRTASAELVGPGGVCSLPTPTPITLPQTPIAGSAFPVWVCADQRAYPEGFVQHPVLESVLVLGSTIQVEVSAAEVSLLPAFPRYWQVMATVPHSGAYTIEYYTVLRPVPGVGTVGESRTLRATLPITVGATLPFPIPVFTSLGLIFLLGGIGLVASRHRTLA